MQVFEVFSHDDASNSYILTQDGKTAVVIDPSGQPVLDALSRHGLCCKFVLLTHGHFDHVGACGVLFSKGAHICCNEHEKDLIFSKDYLSIFGGVTVPEFEISRTFKDGEEVTLCGINFKIIETPGHTAGSCCYLAGSSLFVGDTLFTDNVGRWDLPTGDYMQLLSSVKKLASLEGDYDIYCGHGEKTTLSRARICNPIIRWLNAVHKH